MTESSRKKVLFLITKSNWGGAQRYVYDLATKLPSDQFDPVVAVGGAGRLSELLQQQGLKVYVLKKLKRDISFIDEIATFFTICTVIRKERPDILHVNSSKAGALGALAGRICRVPRVIFTAHGWAFNEDRPSWQKVLLKFIHYSTVMLSHTTIAVSNGLRSQMSWIGAPGKIVVIHPGRTISGMKYRDEARGVLETRVQNTNARLIDYHDDIWIGTVAELHPIKRLNRAINAISALVKEFPKLRYVIINDGELRNELQQQVADLGLGEHVFFLGAIEEAARFMSAFDIFLLPSKSEAFGYVLIEAGQAHVPVIATNVGGIPDIITDGYNGILVPVDDTPAITQALRSLLVDEHRRNELAAAHYERSMTFTAEKMLQGTIAVYRL